MVMWRKALLLVGVLLLLLSSVGTVLADPKPKDDKPDKGPKVEATAEATGTPSALKGKTFQGQITAINGDDKDQWTVNSAKYGDVLVDVSDADIKWPGRKNATLTAFAVDDVVVVQLLNKTTGDGYQMARRVHLIPGSAFVHVTGTLEGVTNTYTVTVTPANGGDAIEFTAGDGTTVKNGPTVTTFKSGGNYFDFGPWTGKMVTVVARESDKTATAIVLHGNHAGQPDGDGEEAED